MSKNKEYLIKRGNSEYEVIIGLEVHAQVILPRFKRKC